MNGTQLMRVASFSAASDESTSQSQSISCLCVGTPSSTAASCVYLESDYEKRRCIPASKEYKRSSPEAEAPRGDEAKIALTVEKKLSTLGQTVFVRMVITCVCKLQTEELHQRAPSAKGDSRVIWYNFPRRYMTFQLIG